MIKDIINNKKMTRKEFLVSAMSLTALLVVNKVPLIQKKKNKDNAYGNYSYGGSSKNNA